VLFALAGWAGRLALAEPAPAPSPPDGSEVVLAFAGPDGLLTALQNERNFGTAWLLGLEQATGTPVASFEVTTAGTDAAATRLRDLIARSEGTIEVPALAALDEHLPRLRAIVQSYQGERGLNNTPTSEPFLLGYVELIDQVFAATGSINFGIDDPSVRRGAQLLDHAARESEDLVRLVRILVLAGVGPGGAIDTPAEIGDGAGLVAAFESSVEVITNGATGDYKLSADALVADPELEQMIDMANEAMTTGGLVNLPAYAPFIGGDAPTSGAIAAFRSSVAATMAEEADQAEAQNASAWDAERLSLAAMAVTAGLVAIAVTAVLVLRRRGRPATTRRSTAPIDTG
jgi:hypothetical protein